LADPLLWHYDDDPFGHPHEEWDSNEDSGNPGLKHGEVK
jgi:hypothetical protein